MPCAYRKCIEEVVEVQLLLVLWLLAPQFPKLSLHTHSLSPITTPNKVLLMSHMHIVHRSTELRGLPSPKRVSSLEDDEHNRTIPST